MKAFRILGITVMFSALLMAAACSKGVAVEAGQDAPDFALTDVDGKPVSLSEFKGKVIILNFFATWCPPCRAEIPDFIELAKAYGDNLAIIGVSDEAQGEVKGFAKSQGINYSVLIDREGKAGSAYGPMRAVPTTFVIDKNFKIRRHYIGARSKETFEADIKEISQ